MAIPNAFLLSTRPENRSYEILCHLNEAWVILVSMFYHGEGIDPSRIGKLFVELYMNLFLRGQMNGGSDGEEMSAVCGWFLCSSIPDLAIVADDGSETIFSKIKFQFTLDITSHGLLDQFSFAHPPTDHPP